MHRKLFPLQGSYNILVMHVIIQLCITEGSGVKGNRVDISVKVY